MPIQTYRTPLPEGLAETLATLHAACFQPPDIWSATAIATLAEMPGVAILLAPPAEAFAMTRTVAGETEILTLATHPAARRRGHARALLDALPMEGPVFLEAAADNAPALALYTRAGFSRAGLRRGYYARKGAPRADALLLRRG